LHGVSFDVAPGEVIGIHGPNGAGKTTLLNTVAGLIRPDAGDVRLDDASIRTLAPHARLASGLALVPEGRQVIGSISVQANLDITLLARRRLRADARHRRLVERMFDEFPSLRERRRIQGSQLSGGEQQMLAIARALMAEPSVLLLDEPSQGLAPAVLDRVKAALHRLKGTVTMVLVEQNEAMLAEVADRRLRLRMGRIAGDPEAARAEGSN
jgi:branched-chain amino acid transport system ATP-binding protein